MKILRVASSMLWREPMEWQWEEGVSANTDADTLAEIAGRNCYQSWHRPTSATSTNNGYIKNILRQQHYSVLEHATVTYKIDEVSTALLGQLSRHRHVSLSVMSARYVDKGSIGAVTPDIIRARSALLNDIETAYNNAFKSYDEIVEGLLKLGYSNKEARQAARYVLPQGVMTSIVITANMRTWREILQKRSHDGADVEIRELMELLLEDLKDIAPNTFQDM